MPGIEVFDQAVEAIWTFIVEYKEIFIFGFIGSAGLGFFLKG